MFNSRNIHAIILESRDHHKLPYLDVKLNIVVFANRGSCRMQSEDDLISVVSSLPPILEHTTASHTTASRTTASHTTASHTTASHTTASHTIASHTTASHTTASHTTASHTTAFHTTASHAAASHITASHAADINVSVASTCQEPVPSSSHEVRKQTSWTVNLILICQCSQARLI